MAEDGMIVNFVLNDAPSTSAFPKSKFKGGSWRDRLRAKQAAQGKVVHPEADRRTGRGPADSVNNIPINKSRTEDFADPRPTKRRRENGEDSDKHHHRGTQRAHLGGNRPAEKGIVSSLFTSNPKPVTAVPTPPHTPPPEEPSKPSNAPLVDGIDTFTSLGLSTTLATHLLTKMELKAPTAIQRAAISQMLAEEGDAFIQSETGSGKTLAYLLPVVQRIMQMAEKRCTADSTPGAWAKLHRDSGLFAIVLAPTRELCKQIAVVLDRLLGCARYIVAGTVIGGEKKKSEKARLRKGLNILVATPGRLVDHLDNTEVLNVSSVRWLILDEGDRLMDMGFEEDISKIVKALDQKKQKGSVPGLPETRTTVLCSATLKLNVQKLGDISLKNASLIKGDADESGADSGQQQQQQLQSSAFLAPAQLKQSYLVVPAKLRLVTLFGLLKRTFARKGSVMKAIVFLSCADSVDFHFRVLTRLSGAPDAPDPPPSEDNNNSDTSDTIARAPMISPDLSVYRLHGSLPQRSRTAIVKSFSTATTPSLLLATDVASRGLDLPSLDFVIEYDPAFSADDHLHRIGRTARLGRDGRATIFLMPGTEEGYVDVLKSSFKPGEAGGATSVTQSDADDVLRKGFTPTTGVVSSSGATTTTTGKKTKEWQQKATDWQLDVERWVLADNHPHRHELAKKAFQSQVRAYATHVAAERKFFDIKQLHLGHLAKAFALRDPPARMNVAGMRMTTGPASAHKRKRRLENGGDTAEAARKMKESIARNRKLMMAGGGADEFNLA
ncbi:hypothetical protein DV735_g3789, partial [Chaetothyriales sp. CBS 134920]